MSTPHASLSALSACSAVRYGGREDTTGETLAADRIAIRIVAHGRVQGVGYRWWAMRRAAALGVDGWVRNRLDGAVEMLVMGSPARVEAMARACWQGPSAARVTSVIRSPGEDDGSVGFDERATI
jgi:acylphosphatase